MRQRNQPVRLFAAVRDIEAEDGRCLAARAAQAAADVGQQVLQGAGWVGIGEESGRGVVLGGAGSGDDPRKGRLRNSLRPTRRAARSRASGRNRRWSG